MDISVTSVTTAYQPQQADMRSNGGDEHGYSRASRGKRQAGASDAEASSILLNAGNAREEVIRGRAAGAEISRVPGFSFEYQDHHQVMKVQNIKGALIYQVPSKGQLTLIEAEDNTQRANSHLRLTV